jgi:hypothetical protein
MIVDSEEIVRVFDYDSVTATIRGPTDMDHLTITRCSNREAIPSDVYPSVIPALAGEGITPPPERALRID